MAEPKITMYDAPRTICYRLVGNPAWPQQVTIFGETSRSYMHGYVSRPRKLAKASITIITEQEYREARFALDHSREIGRLVMYLKDPAILRQIAALVGYEEVPNA